MTGKLIWLECHGSTEASAKTTECIYYVHEINDQPEAYAVYVEFLNKTVSEDGYIDALAYRICGIGKANAVGVPVSCLFNFERAKKTAELHYKILTTPGLLLMR